MVSYGAWICQARVAVLPDMDTTKVNFATPFYSKNKLQQMKEGLNPSGEDSSYLFVAVAGVPVRCKRLERRRLDNLDLLLF